MCCRLYGERVEYYLCVDSSVLWWTEHLTNITESATDTPPDTNLWNLKNPTAPYLVEIKRTTIVEKI